MSPTCSHCHHENPAASRHCNQCGHPLDQGLPPTAPDNRSLVEESHRIRKEFSEAANAEALKIKLELLEAFQEKATKWAKVQFAAGTTALTLLLGVLAYAGFSGFDAAKDYRALVKTSETTITDSLKTSLQAMNRSKLENEKLFAEITRHLNQRKTEIDNKFETADTAIDEKLTKLSQINTEKIGDYQLTLATKIAEINSLKENIESNLVQAEAIIENIRKLENSRFRIIVHYREEEPVLYRNNLKLIEQVLFDKGFIIDQDDIANVRTDRQEILYYSTSPQVMEKVREIQRQLSNQFPDIPIKFVGAASLDSLQVIVKLCPQIPDGKIPCET